MHLFALLVLVFVPCCISRAVNEYGTNLQDEQRPSMVNGQTFKPGQEYQDPPVNGFGDEENRLEDERKTVVNGKKLDPEKEKRLTEIKTLKGANDLEMDNTEYETNFQDKGGSMVNDRTFKPGREYQDPPIAGVGDEGNRNENMQQIKDENSILKDEGKTVVNGKKRDPEKEKRLTEIRTLKGANDVEMDNTAWVKLSPHTSWCTKPGRELISAYVMSPAECHALCDNRPGCKAVEYWEKHGRYCYKCTDTSLLAPYTNTNDLAYPVYVWVHEWRKFSSAISWCTHDGKLFRPSLGIGTTSVFECQKLCQARSGCNAFEYWEGTIKLCFECTDTSKITPYTNTNDPAYPVYVWVPCKKNDP